MNHWSKRISANGWPGSIPCRSPRSRPTAYSMRHRRCSTVRPGRRAALQDAPPPVGTCRKGRSASFWPRRIRHWRMRLRLRSRCRERPSRPSLKRAPQVLAYAPQDNDIRTIATATTPAPGSLRSATARPSTVSRRKPSTCRMASNWKRIPGSARCSTIHATCTKRCAGVRRRIPRADDAREAVPRCPGDKAQPVEPARFRPRRASGATYMLGPRGDFNGCVSIKDYRRFLAAFKRGEITQLVVVARMPSSRRFSPPGKRAAKPQGLGRALSALHFASGSALVMRLSLALVSTERQPQL